MTNRPTGFLRAIFIGIVTCTSIATIPLTAEAAPGDCLVARPKTEAPPGQFWLHLTDWITNRRCWVLRARVETTPQAKGTIAVRAAHPTMRGATGTPPPRAPEDRAPNEAAASTNSPQLHKDDGKAVSWTSAPPERADQSLSYAGHSDAAPLPALASGSPEATDARAPAIGTTPTIAFAVRTQDLRTQEMSRPTNPPADGHTSIEASSMPTPSVVMTTAKTREIGASRLLELLLSAIFFGPALYLLIARAIRRPARSPFRYARLSDASAERSLLPPPRENAAAS